MRLPAACLFLAMAATTACNSSSAPSPDGGSSKTKGCVPLASVAANCPADWAAAAAAKGPFCDKEAPHFEAFLSKAPCRGRLHYTRYLFDGGPRYCLYDAATMRLAGYAAFDGKAMFKEVSCGVAEDDFSDRGCDGETCPEKRLDGGALLTDAAVGQVPVHCDVVAQDCPAGKRCDFFCDDGVLVIGCVLESATPTPVGQTCGAQDPDAGTGISGCAKGSGCFGGANAVTCVQYCRAGSPCPAGTTCATDRRVLSTCQRTSGFLPVAVCL